MKRNRTWTVDVATLLCSLSIGAYGVGNGEKVKMKGLITGRDGDTFTFKTQDQGSVVVVLTDNTKVVQPKGLFGARKAQMSFTQLLPGLKAEVEGVGDVQNRVVAEKVKFSKDDLETAEVIQAGLHPTKQAVESNKQNIATNAENISANKEQISTNAQNIAENTEDIEHVNTRFASLTDYETKYTATVNFANGSKVIPPQDKKELMELAHNAVNLTGYIIEVQGFASTTGSAELNQKLSMQRANAVVAFLLQNCNVPARHILAPGAMGTSNPVAVNSTKEGQAENRRVEVKVLLNKGLNMTAKSRN